MKKKLSTTLIFLGYFLAVAGWFSWRIIQSGNFINWRFWWPVIYWLIGGGVGYWLLTLDRLVDIYLVNPQTQLAHYIRYYIRKGKWRWALKTLKQRRHEQLQLTFRSVLFQVVWVGVALFTLTSTSSLLGKGVVMGLGFHLLLDEWEDYLSEPDFLRRWLFWQVKREVTYREQKIYLWVMVGLMAGFTLILM